MIPPSAAVIRYPHGYLTGPLNGTFATLTQSFPSQQQRASPWVGWGLQMGITDGGYSEAASTHSQSQNQQNPYIMHVDIFTLLIFTCDG